VIGAVDRFIPFVQRFSEFFHTRSNHDCSRVVSYMSGLIQAKRGAKNIERMEEHVPDFEYQNVHHSISKSPWDHRALMDRIALEADGLLGCGRRPRLIFDDTGIAKKGHKSVGVARQYIGRLGKIDNGQVALCASLASGQSSTLIDTRLYLPQQWIDDPKRCREADVPEEHIIYKTKAEMALESALHLRQLGVRFSVVSMDSGYGSQPALLHGLDENHETFVAEIHCDAHIWREQPWHHQEPKRPGAKPLTRPRASSPSQRVDQCVSQRSELDWQRLKVRESDQGWVEVSYIAQRIWVTDGAQEKPWWLLSWENPDEQRSKDKHGRQHGPRRHYALSNAPADADVRQLIADGVERNVVERNFHDAKSECGMADYQTRSWPAWHHHMALVMLVMMFAQTEKMHHTAAAEAPPMTTGDITFVMERLLPQRGYGKPNREEVRQMLQKRILKRATDQARRKAKTKRKRPTLMADEDPFT
jgi:SRSO17 transposase